jgi:hypothetical protein
MGRKGDIVSKVIGVRSPIRVYTKLLNESSDKGISLSEYCLSILSKDNFNQGGQTKIEYQERIIEKKIEVPVYRDRIIEKKVEIENPKISQENVALKNQIALLENEIKKLTPLPKPKKTEGYCKECRRDVKLDENEYCDKCGSDLISYQKTFEK